MKTLWIIFLCAIISCTSSKSIIIGDDAPYLSNFLSKFESAVKAHNEKGILDCMDNAYRFEQHDEFLKGNTEQFLKEFFCGMNTKTNNFQCINELTDIKDIHLKSVKMNKGIYSVEYQIILQNKAVLNCNYWEVKMKMQAGDEKIFGLVGASG